MGRQGVNCYLVHSASNWEHPETMCDTFPTFPSIIDKLRESPTSSNPEGKLSSFKDENSLHTDVFSSLFPVYGSGSSNLMDVGTISSSFDPKGADSLQGSFSAIKSSSSETWVCNICKEDLGERASLIRHLKTHVVATKDENKRSFMCMLCDNSYSQKYNLKRHLKKVHKIEHDAVPMYIQKGEKKGKGTKETVGTVRSPVQKTNVVLPTIEAFETSRTKDSGKKSHCSFSSNASYSNSIPKSLLNSVTLSEFTGMNCNVTTACGNVASISSINTDIKDSTTNCIFSDKSTKPVIGNNNNNTTCMIGDSAKIRAINDIINNRFSESKINSIVKDIKGSTGSHVNFKRKNKPTIAKNTENRITTGSTSSQFSLSTINSYTHLISDKIKSALRDDTVDSLIKLNNPKNSCNATNLVKNKTVNPVFSDKIDNHSFNNTTKHIHSDNDTNNNSKFSKHHIRTGTSNTSVIINNNHITSHTTVSNNNNSNNNNNNNNHFTTVNDNNNITYYKLPIPPPPVKKLTAEEEAVCPFCEKQLATKWSLKRHIDKMHKMETDVKEPSSSVTKVPEPMTEVQHKPKNDFRHQVLGTMSHNCPICQKQLNGADGRKMSLRAHLRDVHRVDVFGNVQPSRTEGGIDPALT